jgi:predicted transcriptional regulator
MIEKHQTVEERVAYLEAKVERLEAIEDQLKRTQQALQDVAATTDRNFAILTGRVSRKSDGFLSDLFNW